MLKLILEKTFVLVPSHHLYFTFLVTDLHHTLNSFIKVLYYFENYLLIVYNKKSLPSTTTPKDHHF